MYLNICEKSLTSVFIFCFKENWEKVPFLKVLDKETPLTLFTNTEMSLKFQLITKGTECSAKFL